MVDDDDDEVPEWGAKAFVASKRRRLKAMELPRPFSTANLLVLGPAGVGKSSLIHTAWRALTGSERSDPALLEKLQLGWDEGLGLRAKHGTTALSSYWLQKKGPEANVGICFQDTKGHQFYDEKERQFAEKLVDGHLRGGSTQERESLYFWAMLSRAGFGRLAYRAELAHSPHCVVLVFDATLRSFAKALLDPEHSAQMKCYRAVARHAVATGLAVFAVLTHLDVYEKNIAAAPASKERRVGEAIAPQLAELKRSLSAAVDPHLLPVDHIFPITNYHAANNARDDAIELAVLDLLDALLLAAEAYLLHRTYTKPVVVASCGLS